MLAPLVGVVLACGRASDADLASFTGGAGGATGGVVTETGGASASATGGVSTEAGSAGVSALAGASGAVNCVGGYESLPVTTPPQALPALLEAPLCNARDSRAWAIAVIQNQPVTITLENPEIVDTFNLGAYRTDVGGYQALPLAAGTAQTRLGALAEISWTFTPSASGAAALYASLGVSRGEPVRLSVVQP